MNVLELFAGSRSVGKVAETRGHKVFSVDWTPYPNIDFVGDIATLKLSDVPFIPDVVWASPDCTTYSIAACSTHRHPNYMAKSDYAKECDSTNQKVLTLLRECQKLNPKVLFFAENPRGLLRKMKWWDDSGLWTRNTVWYCQYGDDRAKPTDIWTNCKAWTPKPPCHNGNKTCHHQPAPRGARTGTQGRANSHERSRIPERLCLSVVEAAEQELGI